MPECGCREHYKRGLVKYVEEAEETPSEPVLGHEAHKEGQVRSGKHQWIGEVIGLVLPHEILKVI